MLKLTCQRPTLMLLPRPKLIIELHGGKSVLGDGTPVGNPEHLTQTFFTRAPDVVLVDHADVKVGLRVVCKNIS